MVVMASIYYGTTGFPSSTFSGSNYWVDVLFKPAASYTFTLTSLTDAGGCTNTGTLSTATVTQSDLQAAGTTWYRDVDGDTYGSTTVTTTACTQPAGYVARSGDCDDNNSNVNPGKTRCAAMALMTTATAVLMRVALPAPCGTATWITTRTAMLR